MLGNQQQQDLLIQQYGTKGGLLGKKKDQNNEQLLQESISKRSKRFQKLIDNDLKEQKRGF